MNTRRVSTTLGVLALGLACAAVPLQGAEAAKVKTFKNCTAMHQVYPHGVGKPGAHDKTSGRPVTTFKKSTALYNANKKSDRDKDGIACEQA